MLLLSRTKDGYDSSATAMYFERFWFRFYSKHAVLCVNPRVFSYVGIMYKYTPYEKQMKGSKHLHTPACTAILVFTGFLAIPREFVENVGTRAKKKEMTGEGEGREGFLFSLPPPLPFFIASAPTFAL